MGEKFFAMDQLEMERPRRSAPGRRLAKREPGDIGAERMADSGRGLSGRFRGRLLGELGMVAPVQCGLHPIRKPRGKLVRPLLYGLQGNPHGARQRRRRSTEQFDCGLLQHA